MVCLQVDDQNRWKDLHTFPLLLSCTLYNSLPGEVVILGNTIPRVVMAVGNIIPWVVMEVGSTFSDIVFVVVLGVLVAVVMVDGMVEVEWVGFLVVLVAEAVVVVVVE